MQRFWVILYLLFFSFMFIVSFIDSDEMTISNPLDYARITDVDYKAKIIDDEGKINVTERLTFDIHALSKNNTFWELWRDLIESEVDGVTVSYDVNYVKQIFDDGSELIFSESPKLYWYDSDYVSRTKQMVS